MDGRFDDDDWEETRRALVDLGLDEIEIKVARLVSGGRKNERIAMDLGTTVSKVKWTLRGLFIKFGVEDRHALADTVGSRLATLRRREGRRRPAARPKQATALRVLGKPRKARRKKPGSGGPDVAGESPAVPPA